ncbi:MAG TPA: cytosolic protein [Candidatus Dormibacteraeota bacterium]|nr:cytosolic protein [Candidatus Dormibacteraeota bacterium]
MSFRQTLRKFFGNRAETREDHVDKTLQTRYYKTTKDRALDSLENSFKNSQTYKLNSISKDHGEISLLKTKGRKAFIVVTVIMVKPFQTAVDFSVSSESILPFDFGYSTKLIQELYELVNKDLPLIDK